MKPLSWSLAAILSLSLLGTACIPQRTPPAAGAVPANGKTKVRIGVDVSLPPFAQPGSNANNPVGFDIDIIQAIADSSGIEVEFVNAEQTQLLMFISQCQLDAGIAGITISEPLKETMNFTVAYYTTGQVVVVKAGNIVINGKDDLTGMKVGTQDNTPSQVELEKISGAQMLAYGTFALAFQDLINGTIDAVVTDNPRAISYVNVKRNNLKIVGAEFGRADYAIAVCKNRPALLEQFDTGLSTLLNNGRLDRLLKKWGIKESLPPVE